MTSPYLYEHKGNGDYHSIGDIAVAICQAKGMKKTDKIWMAAVKDELIKIIQLNTKKSPSFANVDPANINEICIVNRQTENRILDPQKLGKVAGSTKWFEKGDSSDPDSLEVGDKLLLPEYAKELLASADKVVKVKKRDTTALEVPSNVHAQSGDWPANIHLQAANGFNFYSGLAAGKPTGIHGSLSYGLNHLYQAVGKEIPGPPEKTKWVDVSLSAGLFTNYAVTKLDPATLGQLNKVLENKEAIAAFKKGNIVEFLQKSDARLWAKLQPIVHENPTLSKLYQSALGAQGKLGGAGGATHKLLGVFFLAHIGADANALYNMSQQANIDPKDITAFAASTLAKDGAFIYASAKTILTPAEKMAEMTKACKGNPFYQRAFAAWGAGIAVGEFSKIQFLNDPEYVAKRKAAGATDQDLQREADMALRKGLTGTVSAGTCLVSRLAWPVALADMALTAVMPSDPQIAKDLKQRGLDPNKNPFDGIGSCSSVVGFLISCLGIETWKVVQDEVLELFRSKEIPTSAIQKVLNKNNLSINQLNSNDIKIEDRKVMQYLIALADIIAMENANKINNFSHQVANQTKDPVSIKGLHTARREHY